MSEKQFWTYEEAKLVVDENAHLKAEIARLREALEKIGSQSTLEEMEEADDYPSDWDFAEAFESAVLEAREALASKDTP
jgi:hypothetical protein